MRTIGIIGLMLAGLLLAGPPVANAADLRAVGDEVGVGKNAVGEDCRMRLSEARGDGLRYHRYGIFCEGWSQPSGSIQHFAFVPGFPPEKVITDSQMQRSYETRLEACQPPEATTLGKGWAGVIRRCQRKEGSWPVVVAVVTTGKRTYGLETFPANLRVLEAGAEVIEGVRAPGAPAPSAGSLSDAIRRAEAIMGASGKLIGVQDIGAYEDLRALGRRQFYAGNFAASEQTRRRVVEVGEKLFGPDSGALALPVAQLGNSLTMANHYTEAQQALDRAEALAKKSLSVDDLPQTLTYRSWLAWNQGQHVEGERWARAAIQQRELQGKESGWMSDSLGALAVALRGQGRLDEAVAAAERGLRIAEKAGDNPEWRQWWVGQLHQDLGLFYRDLKKYPEARSHFEQAVKRRELLFGPSVRVAFALDALGYTWQLEGNHVAALPSFRRAAEIRRNDRLTRERTRPDDVAPHLGALLAEARRSPADRAALLAEAFVVAQLPRDGQTARALQAMAVRVAAGDPALAAAARALQDATRRRDALRFALGQETLRPANERAPGREEALRTQVAETEQKAGELEEKLQAQFPRYGRLAASQPIPAADLASLLGPTEALVATVTSPNFTWVLLLRGGQVYAHNVRELAREKLQQEVTALRASLVPTDGKLTPFDAAAAHRLYTLLLGPYARELAGVTHLLVSPGGPLLSLPLSVLVTKPPVAGQAPHFLARDMAISVLPTVASLRELRAVAGRSTAPKPFIGFGDPAFGGGAGAPDERSLATAAALCRRGEPMDPAVLRTMPRLPDSAVELREIAKTLGADAGSVVLGADATEARVRATDLSQYRVVVFATHGLLPGELRCQSEPALVLTPPATAASTSDDGMLDASEITQLKLDADWVLLSACNTAGSDGGLGGESLSGLTRAFLYAGARALLVSHWPVASRATTELTTGLFSVLAKDASLGRAEALRRSQLVLLNQRATAHPFFWAPFVLVGDGGGAGVASIGSPSSPPTPLPTSGGRGASTPGR